MDTSELLSCAESDPIVKELFGGVFPRDKLPSKVKTFPRAYIANTDNSREPGKHWVVFFFENEHYAEFFDSYGNAPEYLAPEFERFLKKNVANYVHNTERLQGDYSTVCGQFCLFFLYQRCRGRDIFDIVRLLGDDAEINDMMVNEFINLKYDINYDVTDLNYLVKQAVQPYKSLLNVA